MQHRTVTPPMLIRTNRAGVVVECTPLRVVYASIRAKITRIAIVVADFYGLTSGDILAHRRDSDVSCARHMAVLLAAEMQGATIPILASHFLRDRSTICSSIRAARELLSTSEQYADDYDALLELVG